MTDENIYQNTINFKVQIYFNKITYMAEREMGHGRHPPPTCGEWGDLANFVTFEKWGSWNNFYL